MRDEDKKISKASDITIVKTNIAGAMWKGDAHPNKFQLLSSALAKYTPDIIGLQEVIQVSDVNRDDLTQFKDGLEDAMKEKWNSR